MDFSYSHGYGESRDDAYERVILDALVGDAALFIRADEVAKVPAHRRPPAGLLGAGSGPDSAVPRGHLGTAGSQPAHPARRPPVARALTPWRRRSYLDGPRKSPHTEVGVPASTAELSGQTTITVWPGEECGYCRPLHLPVELER